MIPQGNKASFHSHFLYLRLAKCIVKESLPMIYRQIYIILMLHFQYFVLMVYVYPLNTEHIVKSPSKRPRLLDLIWND